ncbi:MAG: cyclase family protein, partial [Proteobacteria bacterium]|nr:cyclase family protein [Pseudomonadota bacterium]
NHFGADKARADTLVDEGFVGDTSSGGVCNVQTISMTPHCNGTHTETISHIVDELLPPHLVIKQPFVLAALITLSPCVLSCDKESYAPKLPKTDAVISKANLTAALKNLHKNTKALIIRTLPNNNGKKINCYNSNNQAPFFTNQAMQLIAKRKKLLHLLVDMPSVDRFFDEGKLSNHRIFWQVSPGSKNIEKSSNIQRTITEMIYVPNQIKDGYYLLNLQVPKLKLDAVPSNPVLYPLKKHDI